MQIGVSVVRCRQLASGSKPETALTLQMFHLQHILSPMIYNENYQKLFLDKYSDINFCRDEPNFVPSYA